MHGHLARLAEPRGAAGVVEPFRRDTTALRLTG
jgi:hypothetical protein